MPFSWNRMLLIGKIETSYNAAVTMTGAANAFWAKNVQLSPMEGDDIDRDMDLPWFGQSGTIFANANAKLDFDLELEPSGTAGTPPAWGPVMRALGNSEAVVAVTSVTYTFGGAPQSSATFALNIDGVQQQIKGWRGTGVLAYTAQGIPYLKCSGIGLFATPTDTAQLVPVFTAFKAPLASSVVNTPVFTVNGVALVMRNLEFDLGNDLEKRFLIGSNEVIIASRKPTVMYQIEATPVATFNPFTLGQANTKVPLILQHGVAAGRIATLNVPNMQMQRVQGLVKGGSIAELKLAGIPIPTAGNDEYSLVLT